MLKGCKCLRLKVLWTGLEEVNPFGHWLIKFKVESGVLRQLWKPPEEQVSHFVWSDRRLTMYIIDDVECNTGAGTSACDIGR